MFFRRKGWLRQEYNELLLNQLNGLKKDWIDQKKLVEKSFDTSEEVVCQEKLAEAKYFFLFKEAKERKITIKKL